MHLKNKNSFHKNKKAFEMNFTWIFAIIVGAVIIFLAIYATSRWVETRKYEIDTQTAVKLAILLDPLETSLEIGKSSRILFAKETRIYNSCYTSGNFGKHSVALSSKSGIGKEWPKPGGDTQIYNKYLFSQDIEQGKEFSIFTKPFNFPFKISDLIFLSADNYCFIQAPEDIKGELENLNLENIHFDECGDIENIKKVCFSGSSRDCDIVVSGDSTSGRVAKQDETLYYVGHLLYGAVFSNPEIYECNVRRLMLRLVNLGLIYKEKISVVEKRGCNSVLESDLTALSALANSLSSSEDLLLMQYQAEQAGEVNELAICKIF